MGALIFDFDGVIADSEAIANTVLAEIVTELGHSTTLDQALARYSGRRWDEAMAEIEAAIGKPLPSRFFRPTQTRDAGPVPNRFEGSQRGRKFHQTFCPHPSVHRIVQLDRPSAALPVGVGVGSGIRRSRLQCRHGRARKTPSRHLPVCRRQARRKPGSVSCDRRQRERDQGSRRSGDDRRWLVCCGPCSPEAADCQAAQCRGRCIWRVVEEDRAE